MGNRESEMPKPKPQLALWLFRFPIPHSRLTQGTVNPEALRGLVQLRGTVAQAACGKLGLRRSPDGTMPYRAARL